MVNSGHQISNGSVDFYNVYQELVETELARPPQARLTVSTERVSDTLQFDIQLTNLLADTTLSTANDLKVYALVYEETQVGLTGRYVRAETAVERNIELLPGDTAPFSLQTSLPGVNWDAIRAVVLAEYRPAGSNAYDTLQAVRAFGPEPEEPAAATSVYLPLVTRGGGSSPDPNTTTCNDAHEPNDNPAAGTFFEVGSTQSHAFCESGDEDWIAFDVTADTTYRIETRNLTTNTDTVLELYDSSRETLLTSDDDGGDGLASFLEYTFQQAGTYYIKLRQYSNTGDPTYTYDLNIEAITPNVQKTVFEYPLDGQTMNYEGHYLFKVYAVAGADQYQWKFFQNGDEIYRNSP
jgi:hypothetical protein